MDTPPSVWIHVVIPGTPLPFKRRAAVLVPTCSAGEMLSRARRARHLRDLMSLFRATTTSRETKEHKAWREALEWNIRKAAMRQLGNRPLVLKGCPIEVFILSVCELPESRILKRSLRPREWDTRHSSGDFENVTKPVCDAATGLIWHDDCQVVRATIEQIVGAQGEPARLEIIARAVTTGPVDTYFERIRAEAMSASEAGAPVRGLPWHPTSEISLPLEVAGLPLLSRT